MSRERHVNCQLYRTVEFWNGLDLGLRHLRHCVHPALSSILFSCTSYAHAKHMHMRPSSHHSLKALFSSFPHSLTPSSVLLFSSLPHAHNGTRGLKQSSSSLPSVISSRTLMPGVARDTRVLGWLRMQHDEDAELLQLQVCHQMRVGPLQNKRELDRVRGGSPLLPVKFVIGGVRRR